jgi:hypothetical protein
MSDTVELDFEMDYGIDLEKITIDAYSDNVRKPSHYNQGDIECIDAIRAGLGKYFKYYCKGNVMKYIWREDYKNGIEDVDKAIVYLNWMRESMNDDL